MRTLLVLALFLGGCASQRPDFDAADHARMKALYSVMAVDAWQTAKIHRHVGTVEGGPIASRVIGERPSAAQAVGYMAGMAMLYRVVTRHLPPRLRKAAQYFVIENHAASVLHNCEDGC